MPRRRDGPGAPAGGSRDADGQVIGLERSAGSLRWPLLPSLAGYRRSWLGPDLVAGLTLVAIAVPEQMATATLAGAAPVVGLYVFLGAAVGFALVGASPQLSVGADSTIAPVMAAGIATLGVSAAQDPAILPLLSLLVGVGLLAVGLARLGWIADLLSRPVTSGFISGIAVTITLGQLPHVLGVPAGTGTPLERLAHVAGELGAVSPATVAVAVAVLAIVVGSDRLGERVHRHIPGALLALVATLVVSAVLDLPHHGVAVIGGLQAGLPPVALPSAGLATALDLVPLAGAVILICVTQTSATTRTFAELGGYPADVNRDLVGVGAGSILSGLLGGFAVDASPPRTAVVAQAGGRTQLTSLVAAGIVLIVILAATGLLAGLPEATLGGVLLAVAARIFRGRELVAIWRFDRWEAGLAIACLVVVAVIGVLQGIALAVLLAVLDRTRISARPRDAVLGRVPGTTIWWDPREDPRAQAVDGILAYRFDAPLYFANAATFRGRLLDAVGATAGTGPCRLVILDAGAVTDIDYTGIDALAGVLDELARRGIAFALARATGELPAQLERSGLLARIGTGHRFESVDQAAVALGTAR